MELYLLRHGIAEENSATGRDEDRELTDDGRRKLRYTLERAAAAGVRPDLILSSPYVRARQTAEVAKQILGYEEDLEFSKALVPEADPQDIWHEIRTVHHGSTSLLLASHEPLMSRCTGYLLNTPELLVDFKKGALARIDVQQVGMRPRGLLKWMLVPKLAAS